MLVDIRHTVNCPERRKSFLGASTFVYALSDIDPTRLLELSPEISMEIHDVQFSRHRFVFH